MQKTCICETWKLTSSEQPSWDSYESLRRCPAVLMFLPDDLWTALKNKYNGPIIGDAKHMPMILNSATPILGESELLPITRAFHNLILPNLTKLSNQYKTVFQERWVLKESDIDRHQYFRIFFGKVVEVLFAHHVSKTEEILDLEAFGAKDDVVTRVGKNVLVYQIKYIGQKDEDFKHFVEILNEREKGGGSTDRYSQALSNYIVLRAYQAATQFHTGCIGQKNIIIVLSNMSQLNFDLGGIDFSKCSPTACSQNSKCNWHEFLEKEEGLSKYSKDNFRESLTKKECKIVVFNKNIHSLGISELANFCFI